MAAQESPDSQPASFHSPVFDQRFFAVSRAGGLKTTSLWQEGGNHSLVNVDDQNEQFFHHIT